MYISFLFGFFLRMYMCLLYQVYEINIHIIGNHKKTKINTFEKQKQNKKKQKQTNNNKKKTNNWTDTEDNHLRTQFSIKPLDNFRGNGFYTWADQRSHHGSSRKKWY